MICLFLFLFADQNPSLILMCNKSEWIGIVKAESEGFAVVETIKGSQPNWPQLGPPPNWAKELKNSDNPLLILIGENETGLGILGLFEVIDKKAIVPENIAVIGNIRQNGEVGLDWFRLQALPMPNPQNMPSRKSADLSEITKYAQEHGCEGQNMAVFECRINRNGKIDQVYWIRYWECLDPEYQKAVEEALKKTLFDPFLVQNQPTAFKFTMSINHFAPCGCD